jgi:hypothetical protein
VLSAVALAACSPPAGSSNDLILKDIGPVKTADIVPELVAALRSQLKIDIVANSDVSAAYVAMDKHLAPLIADFQARLAKAHEQVGTAPGPIVKASPLQSASQASFGPGRFANGSTAQSAGQVSTARIGSNDAGRESIIKTVDSGDQWNDGDWVGNVKGTMETYIENREVVVHWEVNGHSENSSRGRPDTNDGITLVEGLLVGESADKKTGRKTYVEGCPDASGLSHGKLYFQMTTGVTDDGPAGRRSGQATFIVTADLLGHVDDSATLTSYDLINLSFQRSATASGAPDSMGFFVDGVSNTGIPLVGPEGPPDVWHATGTVTEGPSARIAIHNMKRSDAQREIGHLVAFAKIQVQDMYRIAQKVWRDGRCVKVAATQGPDPKRLKPGQTTHFTIEVFHKPDNAKLDVPVVATAHNGKVAPEGKVMPPAKYTFTAAGGKTTRYGVSLKSTSRRGIGELDLSFSLQAYKLTITGHSSATVPPAIPASTSKIAGTVASDPTDNFLVGPGTAMVEVFVNTDLGCPGTWKGEPRTLPVELKALDKGDGTFELHMHVGTFGGVATGSEAPPAIGTFPAGDGVHTSFGSGTLTTTDECSAENGPITLTTVTVFDIAADPVPP